jgi:hypothetical protein
LINDEDVETLTNFCQILALAAILIVMGYWRRSPAFFRQAYTVNVAMMTIGFVLMGYQFTGYFIAA